MSMLPPASVGGTESTRAEVSRATPIIPMNGCRSNPTGTVTGQSSAQPAPRALRGGEDADVATLVEVAARAAGSALNCSGYSPGQRSLAVAVGDDAVRHPQRQVQHLDLEDVTRFGAPHRDRTGDHVGARPVVRRTRGHRDGVGEHRALRTPYCSKNCARVLALVLQEALVGDRVEGDDVAGAHHGHRRAVAVGQPAPQHLLGPGPHVAATRPTVRRAGAPAPGAGGRPPARPRAPLRGHGAGDRGTRGESGPGTARRRARRPRAAPRRRARSSGSVAVRWETTAWRLLRRDQVSPGQQPRVRGGVWAFREGHDGGALPPGPRAA